MSRRKRLSKDEVIEIRKRAKPCAHCGETIPYKNLAEVFDVSVVTIHKVIKRHIYKDVE